MADMKVWLSQRPTGIAIWPGFPGAAAGYAILLELSMMEDWLAQWDRAESSAAWQPYNTLNALADGSGGYLAPVLAHVRASQ